MSDRTLSPTGLTFLAGQEGEVDRVYTDQGGQDTVGVGHLLRPGESYPNGITHEQALEILRGDVRTAEVAVNTLVKVPLRQHQFDALVSFTFNCGPGALAQSLLLRKLNAGDYQGAADQLLQWCHLPSGGISAGLMARRRAERELFLRDDDTQPDAPAALANGRTEYVQPSDAPDPPDPVDA